MRKSTLAPVHKPCTAHAHTERSQYEDSARTETQEHRGSRQRENSGAFVRRVLKRDEAGETTTPEFPLSVPHLEHPLLQQGHVSRLLASMCTQPTHGAQQQQHTAHHNGDHDGQLTATQLHFGDGVMKVPHLHLQGEKRSST